MMTGRDVESFEDDVLETTDTGEASTALLSAVTAPRTGLMGDIVATIQREQDEIIRDQMRGVLVVQGRSEEHTSELQSRGHLVCRLLLEKKKTVLGHLIGR